MEGEEQLEAKLGGVVFRVGAALHFMPANTALKVTGVPEIARVPGAPDDLLGIALVDGETIPIVSLGTRPGRDEIGAAMLVCTYLGDRVGFVGLQILATGRFDTIAPDTVMWGDHPAKLFDISAAVARVRRGRWAV